MRRSSWVRNPFLSAALAMIALVVAGFASLWFGWRGAAATHVVPIQVAFVVSGGLGGLALITLGIVLLSIHVGRRDAARAQAKREALIRAAEEIANALSKRS